MKYVNLDYDYDKLPKSVRRAISECVAPLGSQGDAVVVPRVPARLMVERIKRADRQACTGDNTRPFNNIGVLNILRGIE